MKLVMSSGRYKLCIYICITKSDTAKGCHGCVLWNLSKDSFCYDIRSYTLRKINIKIKNVNIIFIALGTFKSSY